MTRAILAALVVLTALPASAQQLSLTIQDGLVTMNAAAVPVRDVLAAWSRVGGTRVIGAERVSGPPLTLTFEKVPEAQALDIILRGAAGYVAAARAVPGTGSSNYDRILVLASSTPPAATAAAGPRGGSRFTPTDEPPEVVENPDFGTGVPEMPQVPDPQNPFAAAFAQPGVQQFGQPAVNPFGQPGAANPFQPVQPDNPFQQAVPFGQQPGAATPFGVPMTPNGNGLFVPVPQPQDQMPQGFFGPVGSATPGMVQQPTQPGQPTPRPRQ